MPSLRDRPLYLLQLANYHLKVARFPNPVMVRLSTPFLLVSLTVSTSALFSSPLVKPLTIDDEIGIGYGLELTDINGDGLTDILLVDKDNVAWYQNSTWEKHIISGHPTERDHVCLAARDIDGDNQAEVTLGAQWQPRDTENSGA